MSDDSKGIPADIEADLRDRAAGLDAADGLAKLRERFTLPEGVVYLDGNSLGALPAGVADTTADVVARQWGELLIRSWDESGWWTAPERIGDKLAPSSARPPARWSSVIPPASISSRPWSAPPASRRPAGPGCWSTPRPSRPTATSRSRRPG